LLQRKQHTEKLLKDFEKKLNSGEGNAMDVHKSQLQLIEIEKEWGYNSAMIVQLNERLTQYNGGHELALKDTVYFPLPDSLSFDQLASAIKENDPQLKSLEHERLISQKQVLVTKAMTLPKLETGYHYQGILGQTFQGIHLGVTVPLWEHKNRVKLQQSKTLYSDLALQEYQTEHIHGLKQLYSKYETLKASLKKYEEVLLANKIPLLLNKSLALGNISTIEYFLETNYYYTAFNNYLKTEKEYYEVVAELYKYRL
jgi:outer membrane protein, heavy metal efflux system